MLLFYVLVFTVITAVIFFLTVMRHNDKMLDELERQEKAREALNRINPSARR